jgi:allantoate deiminase
MSIIIDYDQLAGECLERCSELASYTESPGQITRRFLTPPMQDVHAAVTHWMSQMGVMARVDHVGNVIGSRVSANPNCKTLLIGSHLDTVPNAGKYDGILGVVIGIAVLKALKTVELPFAIDVIGFSEEEGVRFSTPYLGSRAIAGDFEVSWLDLVDSQGQSMRSVIETFGLAADKISLTSYAPDHVLGFIEAHIEQGPVLARVDQPVAVVTDIAGQSRLKMRFHGCSGHAGTTPMSPRADALVAAPVACCC